MAKKSAHVKLDFNYKKGGVEKESKKALEEIAEMLQEEVRARAPVDTGALRKSIDYKITGESITIGSDLDYALGIEKGTSTRRATPFIEPAVKENKGKIQDMYVNAINKALKGASK